MFWNDLINASHKTIYAEPNKNKTCSLSSTKHISLLMRASSESTPIHFPNWIASHSPDGSNSLLRRNKTRYDKNIRFHKALVSWHVILYYLRDIIPFVCDSFPRFVSLNESAHTKRVFRRRALLTCIDSSPFRLNSYGVAYISLNVNSNKYEILVNHVHYSTLKSRIYWITWFNQNVEMSLVFSCVTPPKSISLNNPCAQSIVRQVLLLNMTREIIAEELSGSMERKLNDNYEALA